MGIADLLVGSGIGLWLTAHGLQLLLEEFENGREGLADAAQIFAEAA